MRSHGLGGDPPPDPQGGMQARRTRWIALAVLIPTVPLFLGSVALLGLFYAAPDRFGSLLARVPGFEILRGVLFFAPASLFAVGVLAALYALEAGRTPSPEPSPQRDAAPGWLRSAAGLALTAASFSTLVVTWVAPGRTTRILEALPGDLLTLGRLQYAAAALGTAGLVLLALSAWRRTERGLGDRRAAGVASWASSSARLILLPTLPLFVLSLAGLALSFAQPKSFAAWIDRIALEDWIRLAVIFTPTTLAAVVILSLMVLRGQARAAAVPLAVGAAGRSTAAVWILVGGLSLTAGMGLGVLGALALLFLR